MTEPSLAATLAAAAALAAFVTGFLRASVGGGIGLALTPVLSLALPAQSALGLTGFMLNLADPFVLRYYWRQWDVRQLRLILPTALVGILLGVWLISGMPDHRLRKVIGAAALVLAALQLVFMRAKIHVGHHWGVGSRIGVLILYLGSWLGWRVNAYIPRRWFALALIAISVAGSLKLLLT